MNVLRIAPEELKERMDAGEPVTAAEKALVIDATDRNELAAAIDADTVADMITPRMLFDAAALAVILIRNL